jgi:hypothetical protein
VDHNVHDSWRSPGFQERWGRFSGRDAMSLGMPFLADLGILARLEDIQEEEFLEDWEKAQCYLGGRRGTVVIGALSRLLVGVDRIQI